MIEYIIGGTIIYSLLNECSNVVEYNLKNENITVYNNNDLTYSQKNIKDFDLISEKKQSIPTSIQIYSYVINDPKEQDEVKNVSAKYDENISIQIPSKETGINIGTLEITNPSPEKKNNPETYRFTLDDKFLSNFDSLFEDNNNIRIIVKIGESIEVNFNLNIQKETRIYRTFDSNVMVSKESTDSKYSQKNIIDFDLINEEGNSDNIIKTTKTLNYKIDIPKYSDEEDNNIKEIPFNESNKISIDIPFDDDSSLFLNLKIGSLEIEKPSDELISGKYSLKLDEKFLLNFDSLYENNKEIKINVIFVESNFYITFNFNILKIEELNINKDVVISYDNDSSIFSQDTTEYLDIVNGNGENIYTSTQKYDYKIIVPEYPSPDDNNFVINQEVALGENISITIPAKGSDDIDLGILEINNPLDESSVDKGKIRLILNDSFLSLFNDRFEDNKEIRVNIIFIDSNISINFNITLLLLFRYIRNVYYYLDDSDNFNPKTYNEQENYLTDSIDLLGQVSINFLEVLNQSNLRALYPSRHEKRDSSTKVENDTKFGIFSYYKNMLDGSEPDLRKNYKYILDTNELPENITIENPVVDNYQIRLNVHDWPSEEESLDFSNILYNFEFLISQIYLTKKLSETITKLIKNEVKFEEFEVYTEDIPIEDSYDANTFLTQNNIGTLVKVTDTMVKYILDPKKSETFLKLNKLKELIEKDEESQNKNYYDVFQYEVKTEYEGKEYTFTRIIALLLYSPS